METQNENIIVYPPIKITSEYYESKKYLSFFSKKISNRIPSEKIEQNNNQDSTKEKEKDSNSYNSIEDELFLINKGIEQMQTKSKRTNDVRSALESFLRKSDLIVKITKFFEENNKQKKGGKNEIEEEKQKLTEIYINSIITKLAESVDIKIYKKNEFVIKMGEIGESCYFLLSGKLSVLKPVEYHIELTFDEYMQYLANLIKDNEFEIIENIRRINQSVLDILLVEDLDNLVKSYFIMKIKT